MNHRRLTILTRAPQDAIIEWVCGDGTNEGTAIVIRSHDGFDPRYVCYWGCNDTAPLDYLDLDRAIESAQRYAADVRQANIATG